MKRKWYFFYKRTNGEEVLHQIKECIAPMRTNVWKLLNRKLSNDDDVCGIGYTSRPEDYNNLILIK